MAAATAWPARDIPSTGRPNFESSLGLSHDVPALQVLTRTFSTCQVLLAIHNSLLATWHHRLLTFLLRRGAGHRSMSGSTLAVSASGRCAGHEALLDHAPRRASTAPTQPGAWRRSEDLVAVDRRRAARLHSDLSMRVVSAYSPPQQQKRRWMSSATSMCHVYDHKSGGDSGDATPQVPTVNVVRVGAVRIRVQRASSFARLASIQALISGRVGAFA